MLIQGMGVGCKSRMQLEGAALEEKEQNAESRVQDVDAGFRMEM